MFSTNPFGQSSIFGQTSNTNTNPFVANPTGSSNPFGSPTGGSLFGGMSTGVIGQPSTPLFGASPAPAFGSSTPTFGAPSTSAFGSTSSFGGSSTFGQKPAFGGFGSTTPTQPSPFGSTSFQQTQPSFGSNPFGSTLAFGGTSQPAFGASSTTFGSSSIPAFGASSTPSFGALSTPSFGALSTSAFGTASTPAFGAASTPAFGASTPAFGSMNTPAFGSSSPLFGSTGSTFGVSSTPTFGSTTSAFGAPSASSFGMSSTPAFGASAAAFSASSSPSFGFNSSPAFGQSTSGFGSTPFGATPSLFGSQGSAFGGQTTPTFGSTGFGQSSSGGQQVGSRVGPYAPTPEVDGSTGTTAAGKVVSISAMPIYKDKNHEELRWEDYQRGDKGGPSSAGTPGNLFTSAFGQGASNSNNFSLSTSNQFGNKTSFGSTGFGLSSTTNNLFGSPSPSPFGSPSGTNPFFGTSAPFSSTTTSQLFSTGTASSFSSSPSFFTSSIGATSAFGTGMGFPNTQSSGLFQSSSSPFGQTMPLFSQSTGGFQQTSSFPNSSPFNNPSTGGGFFSSSTLSLPSSSSSFGFNQTMPSVSTTFLSGPPPASGPSLFGSYGQTQPAFSASSSGFGSISNMFNPNTFVQPSASQPNLVMQPTTLVNPFGTLPVVPQISIGAVGSSPQVQYGISSLPDVEKTISVRLSTLAAAPRHVSRRIRMPVRKYHPKPDEQKVAFLMDDDEVQSTPKADASFIPRENPRALVIRPIEQWPPQIGMEKPIPWKEGKVVTGKNGKLPGDPLANGSFSEDHEDIPTENGHFTEKYKRHGGEEGPSASVQRSNGFSNDHAQRASDPHYRTISGHRAGEAAIVYEHGADIEALMPKLRHGDYYTEPRIQELATKERTEPGFCRRVKEFVVGRHGFGSIKFDRETDVRCLDLESIIQFNHREVIVYKDESKKPPVGQGLNKPAEVTLLNIKCMNKKTGQQYTEGPRVEKYTEMLMRKSQEQGAEFVSYEPVQGEWKFRVKHFSCYDFREPDDS